jgi:hypothetical protein
MIPPEDSAGAGEAEEIGEAGGFGTGEFAPGGRKAVVAAAFGVGGIVVAGRVDFLDEVFFEERLHGAIEGAGTEAHAAAALFFDLAHDAVAVAVFAGESEKDMEGGGGERIEFPFGHDSR